MASAETALQLLLLILLLLGLVKGKSVPLQARGAQRVSGS